MTPRERRYQTEMLVTPRERCHQTEMLVTPICGVTHLPGALRPPPRLWPHRNSAGVSAGAAIAPPSGAYASPQRASASLRLAAIPVEAQERQDLVTPRERCHQTEMPSASLRLCVSASRARSTMIRGVNRTLWGPRLLFLLATEPNMTIRIIRLGTPRLEAEGLRIGTVRRPPRGVPKAEYGSRNIYDVWFPNLAPSEALLANPPVDERSWKTFRRRFLAEMNAPQQRRDLDLLAALSHHTNLALGCYCEEEERCHRSVLRELLEQRGADLA